MWCHNATVSSVEKTRLLIATGEAVASVDELPPLVRALIDTASEILVMTPILTGALQWLASDTDQARYEADQRLETILGHVQALAPESDVRAQVGDETPLTAFADAIRQFGPDHILIALRRSDHKAWQERHLIDRIRENFRIPITVFEIDRAGHVPASMSS